MYTPEEKELTEEEIKKLHKRRENKGIRTLMCSKCGTTYTGKYYAGIVVCGRCLKNKNLYGI